MERLEKPWTQTLKLKSEKKVENTVKQCFGRLAGAENIYVIKYWHNFLSNHPN